MEKLLYFLMVAVSNHDGVSFYSDARLAELLDIRFPHELDGARNELVARDLIAYEGGIYQVLDLSVPGKALMVLPHCPTTLCVRVPLSRPFAEPRATRLRIWRASSSCYNAGAGRT